MLENTSDCHLNYENIPTYVDVNLISGVGKVLDNERESIEFPVLLIEKQVAVVPPSRLIFHFWRASSIKLSTLVRRHQDSAPKLRSKTQ